LAVKSRRQLRARQLEDRIELVIKELVSRARVEKRHYVYNASQVALLVPTTRKTLRKREEGIGLLLQKLKIKRREVTGKATMSELRNQVTYLRSELDRRDRVIKHFRLSHTSIYHCFLASSFDGTLLLRAIERQAAEAAVDEGGKCSLCGATSKIESRVKGFLA
jgi:hypothetical protein